MMDVLIGNGMIRILKVQREGAKPTPAATIIRSISDTLGRRTVDLLRHIDALERQVAQLMEAHQ